MSLDLLKEKGTPIEKQRYTLRELSPPPISKLDNDAFTRVRIILMNGIEQEQNRFLHMVARSNRSLREAAARIRRSDHHQQTIVNWLLPGDQSVLETTIGYEQVAIEVTASVAQAEPDPYLAQVYRFGLLEDFDHMYRYSALMDRVEGKDANNILQSYTDVLPGRATSQEHRAPEDDLRDPYARGSAHFLSKLNALTIMSGEYQTRNYYMTVGPSFSEPVARQLYAEIASIEEQHVTQYESLLDPEETLLEKWLLHEANEVYNYFSCAEFEGDSRVKKIWERFCDYELGHLHIVKDLFEREEKRDAQEILEAKLPEPIQYKSHRDYVRKVLEEEVSFEADGPAIGPTEPTERTARYREHLNSEGSPSEEVAAGYRWMPGTELVETALR